MIHSRFKIQLYKTQKSLKVLWFHVMKLNIDSILEHLISKWPRESPPKATTNTITYCRRVHGGRRRWFRVPETWYNHEKEGKLVIESAWHKSELLPSTLLHPRTNRSSGDSLSGAKQQQRCFSPPCYLFLDDSSSSSTLSRRFKSRSGAEIGLLLRQQPVAAKVKMVEDLTVTWGSLGCSSSRRSLFESSQTRYCPSRSKWR